MNYKALYEHERKRSEKMKELIELLKWMAKDITPYYAKFTKLESELSAIEAESGEEEDKPKKKARNSFKICAGCGSLAHGNPGHNLI